MIILEAVLLIVVGLAVMGFGLFLFYAFLPLFYAFFGFGVGYSLGSYLASAMPGDLSLIKLIFALGGSVVFAAGAYFWEPIRRILIGIGLGSLLGGLAASALGLTGFLGVVFMVVAAVICAGITLAVFEMFIVVASALGGAGLAIDGTHIIFQSLALDMFDRTTIANGAVAPLLIWFVIAAIGMGWQITKMNRWTDNAG